MKRLLTILSVVTVLTLALPVAALAQGGTQDGRVIFGGNFTLRSGDTMDGDLIVLGGNATLEEGAVLMGDMAVIGGNAVVAAEITGDVSIIGGNVSLLNSAIVSGDIVTFGGNVDRAERAEIRGNQYEQDSFELPFRPRIGQVRIPDIGEVGSPWSPIVSVLWFLFRTLLLSALAVLVVMFWPQAAERTADAIVDQPLATGGLGLLTVLVAPFILVLLAITILLSPVSFIGALLLVVAGLFGWIAVGLEVGRRLTSALNWEMHVAAAAGLGTLLLTFVFGGIGLIPCIGWLASLVVIALGVGGVILTRFGSQAYEVADPVTPSNDPSRRKRKVAKSDE